MSMMVMAQRMGMLRDVAQRDDANCLLVKTGWKLCCYLSNQCIYAVTAMTEPVLKDQELAEVHIC